MDVECNKYKTPKQQMPGEPDDSGAIAQSIQERGAEVYGKAEQAVGDIYNKTVQTVSETFGQAKRYSNENPGKTILIALGIGVGLGAGFLLGASAGRSRNGRFAQPVVKAVSAIARTFFR